MKTITAAALAASITLLAACAQSGHTQSHDHSGHNHAHHQGVDMSGPATFQCDNGLTVKVQNAGEDKVKVSVDGREALMSIAPSGSGERYVASSGLWGHGGEWHQKGAQAHFAYTGLHGAKGETACYYGK